MKKIWALLFAFPALLFAAKARDDSVNIAKKAAAPTKERHFVIAVPSYNNDQYYQRNLDSIFSQEYENYHVYYVDDASKDHTYENVKNYIESRNLQDKITLIHNEVNRGALYNIYTIAQMCNNDSIMVLVDGDDWVENPRVLKNLNLYYENEDVWLTYGQFIRYPSNFIGHCEPVSRQLLKEGKFRSHYGWVYSHLRTFYVGLFKRVKLNDLIYKDKFYAVGWDLPMIYPMLEMARTHVYFTPEVLYVYNQETPLNDFKLRPNQQEIVDKWVRKLPSYPTLNKHPTTPISTDDNCDLVVFSYNRPMQLYSFLESVQKRVSGLRKITVIYRQDPSYASSYEIVKKTFPDVIFKKQSDQNPHKDFKPLVIQSAFGDPGAKYILFGVDDLIVTDFIDVKEGIKMLESTGAYGFYYRMGKHIDYCYTQDFQQGVPKLIEVTPSCLAWRFEWGKGDWDYPNSVDFVLYRKRDVHATLKKIEYAHPNFLEGQWSHYADHKKIGLCAPRAKTVNIPINKVTTFHNKHANLMSPQEMDAEFQKGYKIDITPLFQLDNRSAHTEILPSLIPR